MAKKNPYTVDSHIIDYFLSLAEKMESQLDKEAYAYVQNIFSNDEQSAENIGNLPLGDVNIESLPKKPIKNLTQKL